VAEGGGLLMRQEPSRPIPLLPAGPRIAGVSRLRHRLLSRPVLPVPVLLGANSGANFSVALALDAAGCRALHLATVSVAALEILLRHLLVADILGADSPTAALNELRQETIVETKALCDLARRTRQANPKTAAEALAVAEGLVRNVDEIASDVSHGDPIGPRMVMRQRATV